MTISNGSLPDADDMQTFADINRNLLVLHKKIEIAHNEFDFINVTERAMFDVNFLKQSSVTSIVSYTPSGTGTFPMYYLDSVASTGQYVSVGLPQQPTIDQGTVLSYHKIVDIVDDFQDASISGNWTTSDNGGGGGVSETGGYIQFLAGTGGGTQWVRGYWTANDYLNTHKTVHLLITQTNVASPAGKIRITNGSTSVQVGTISGSQSVYFVLSFRGTDNQVDVYSNGIHAGTYDISTVTTNQYIDIYLEGEGDYLRCYLFAENSTSEDSTVTSRVRLDGSNWNNTSVNSKAMTSFGYTGTNPELEINFARASGEAILFFGYGFSWL